MIFQLKPLVSFYFTHIYLFLYRWLSDGYQKWLWQIDWQMTDGKSNIKQILIKILVTLIEFQSTLALITSGPTCCTIPAPSFRECTGELVWENVCQFEYRYRLDLLPLLWHWSTPRTHNYDYYKGCEQENYGYS